MIVFISFWERIGESFDDMGVVWPHKTCTHLWQFQTFPSDVVDSVDLSIPLL